MSRGSDPAGAAGRAAISAARLAAARHIAAGTRPRRRAGRSRGVLPVIAGLLLASALVRLGDDGWQALAVGAADPTDADSAADPALCEAPPDTAGLIAAFQTREARLQQREAQITDRMQALRLAEAEIGDKLTALQAAQERLESTLALSETAAEDDLARLTAVYENMRPEDAATLFGQMAPDFAAGFIGRMRPEAAAPVLSQLEPEIAYSISAIMAGRNAGAPTQ